ncbi:MAG: hypothetical protein JWO13_485 [Acidobacteriales bacterium]|nr:hypothetical protein [Terriglobales bacterium]
MKTSLVRFVLQLMTHGDAYYRGGSSLARRIGSTIESSRTQIETGTQEHLESADREISIASDALRRIEEPWQRAAHWSAQVAPKAVF